MLMKTSTTRVSSAHRIELVGNIMIDSVEMLRAKIEGLTVWRDLGLAPQGYGVATIHRPANVDRSEVLESIVTALIKMFKENTCCFPRASPDSGTFGKIWPPGAPECRAPALSSWNP